MPRSMLDKEATDPVGLDHRPRTEAAINGAGWAGIMSLPRQLAIGRMVI